MAPKQTDPQFKLRMTPEIKDAIEKTAIANNRSMNAEILDRLQRSFHEANVGGTDAAQFQNHEITALIRNKDLMALLAAQRALSIQNLEIGRAIAEILDEMPIAEIEERVIDRKEQGEILSRYIDMDVNSYGNIGDFAQLDKDGHPTRSATVGRRKP